MSLGHTPTQGDILRSSAGFCSERLSPTSIYVLLHRESHRLFPDESFADLYAGIGRWSVPPRILAVVMVLQRLEGLSDREAVDRFGFDLRWKYAAGGLDFDYPSFGHTVLVGMRERLRRSERPNRIFEVSLEVARSAGLVGRKRVLDSTPLYDAVATQDTVTLIRSAIRGLLQATDEKLEGELRQALQREDDYAAAGKPACDWDNKEAREMLVDALARDAYAALLVLDGRELTAEVKSAAALLATVVGQDLEPGPGPGSFRIARRVAPDRVISTVDSETRHGHKTAARGFDGYKGHVAIDPDSEIITATEVTAGNVADASPALALLAEVLPSAEGSVQEAPEAPAVQADEPAPSAQPVEQARTPQADVEAGAVTANDPPPVEVFGDAAYGTGELLARLEGSVVPMLKVQAPAAPNGIFSKERFQVDLDAGTVTCPAGQRASIRPRNDGGGIASFGALCATCPMRAQCTTSTGGRNVNIHPQERLLSGERERQKDPAWKQRYKATRPKVERKLGHMMRRRHGGRRARVRGRLRIAHDFALLAAATNLARLAVLRVQLGRIVGK
jgi:Transposase DDE domain/Transposase domain (DUF772)